MRSEIVGYESDEMTRLLSCLLFSGPLDHDRPQLNRGVR
jgi:hypothetical protein